MASITLADELPELCPFGNRRPPEQLYIKLAIVCITVLFSLCHLIHVRRDYGVAIMLILFTVVSPITVVVQLILPIPLLIIQAIRTRGDIKLLQQSLAALIGEIAKDEASQTDAENATGHEPDSTEAAAAAEPVRLWHWTVSWKKVARSLPLLAVLTQSITSIWLFSRRFQPSIAYDHYILQLAVVGVLASTLSVIHLFLEPKFPANEWALLDPKLRWLIAFRPTYRKHSESLARLFLKTSNSDAMEMLDMITTLIQFSIVGVVTTSIANMCQLEVPLGGWFTWDSIRRTPTHWRFLFKPIVQALPFAILLAITLLRRRLWQNRFMVLKGIGGILLVPIVFALVPVLPGFLGDIAFFTSTSFIFNIQLVLPANHHYGQTSNDQWCPSTSTIHRVADINTFPTRCSCLAILQDPVADMVWALA